MKVRDLASQFVPVFKRSGAEKLARQLKADPASMDRLVEGASNEADHAKLVRAAVKLCDSRDGNAQQVGRALLQAVEHKVGTVGYRSALQQVVQTYRDKRIIHIGSKFGLPATLISTVVGLAAGGPIGLLPLAVLGLNSVAFAKTRHADRRLAKASEALAALGSPEADAAQDADPPETQSLLSAVDMQQEDVHAQADKEKPAL